MAKVEQAAEAALTLIFGTENLTLAKISEISTEIQVIFHNFEKEASRVKDFKFDIRWKSRVINVPKAIEHVKELIAQIQEAIHDRGKTIILPFITFVHDLKLLSLAASEQVVDPNISSFTKNVSAVQQFVTQLDILVGQIAGALQKVQDFQALFDRILKDIETLDDAFLGQTNPRQVIKTDIGPLKIRRGKLHENEPQ